MEASNPGNQEQQQSSRRGCLFPAQIIILLLYVFSTPFVEQAIEDSPADVQNTLWKLFEIVYFPLIWSYEHVESIENFYDWCYTLVDRLK